MGKVGGVTWVSHDHVWVVEAVVVGISDNDVWVVVEARVSDGDHAVVSVGIVDDSIVRADYSSCVGVVVVVHVVVGVRHDDIRVVVEA